MKHNFLAQFDDYDGAYKVPGTENMVQLGSDPICSSAGCEQYLHPKPKNGTDWPKNYAVPNFGADRGQVIASFDSIDTAEGIVGKKWVWKEMKK